MIPSRCAPATTSPADGALRFAPSRQHHRAAPVSAACIAAALLASCASPPSSDADRATVSDSVQRSADRQFVGEPFKDQARQGVIRQRALFEAHFVPESDRLTSLGRRDIAILADAMRTSGGGISIRCSHASPTLYAARVERVRNALIASGIDSSRVRVDDALPGGTGTITDDALFIRADIRAMPMTPISDGVVPPSGNLPQQGSTP